MKNIRRLRLEEFIRRSIEGQLVMMDDPDLRLLTVTRIELSSDTRLAKVFVSSLSDDETRRTALMAALSRASGRFQQKLASDVKMRFTPLLSFHFDHGFVKGTQVVELLTELEKSEKKDTADS
ncbi:MAG: 30S ribosome-binding factor RbfA [Candidatus Cryosericum sp.]|jgi:ribosome-binding factor A